MSSSTNREIVKVKDKQIFSNSYWLQDSQVRPVFFNHTSNNINSSAFEMAKYNCTTAGQLESYTKDLKSLVELRLLGISTLYLEEYFRPSADDTQDENLTSFATNLLSNPQDEKYSDANLIQKTINKIQTLIFEGQKNSDNTQIIDSSALNDLKIAEANFIAKKAMMIEVNTSGAATVSAGGQGNGGHWMSIDIRKTADKDYEICFFNSSGQQADSVPNEYTANTAKLVQYIHNIKKIETALQAQFEIHKQALAEANLKKLKLLCMIHNCNNTNSSESKKAHSSSLMLKDLLVNGDNSELAKLLNNAKTEESIKQKIQPIVDYYNQNKNSIKTDDIKKQICEGVANTVVLEEIAINYEHPKNIVYQNDGALCGIASTLNTLLHASGYRFDKAVDFSSGGKDISLIRTMFHLIDDYQLSTEDMLKIFLTHSEMPVKKNGVKVLDISGNEIAVAEPDKEVVDFVNACVDEALKPTMPQKPKTLKAAYTKYTKVSASNKEVPKVNLEALVEGFIKDLQDENQALANTVNNLIDENTKIVDAHNNLASKVDLLEAELDKWFFQRGAEKAANYVSNKFNSFENTVNSYINDPDTFMLLANIVFSCILAVISFYTCQVFNVHLNLAKKAGLILLSCAISYAVNGLLFSQEEEVIPFADPAKYPEVRNIDGKNIRSEIDKQIEAQKQRIEENAAQQAVAVSA
ncbi:MAG: hypothetical protein BGO27_05695 [Alphaproteobacteria bacterium 33-17]|nr:MAG: hypothetical protein BGO27_05695 [Alphaproteobacteria bacterium 33-17]